MHGLIKMDAQQNHLTLVGYMAYTTIAIAILLGLCCLLLLAGAFVTIPYLSANLTSMFMFLILVCISAVKRRSDYSYVALALKQTLGDNLGTPKKVPVSKHIPFSSIETVLIIVLGALVAFILIVAGLFRLGVFKYG